MSFLVSFIYQFSLIYMINLKELILGNPLWEIPVVWLNPKSPGLKFHQFYTSVIDFSNEML